MGASFITGNFKPLFCLICRCTKRPPILAILFLLIFTSGLFSQPVFFENFESYTPGTLLNGQGSWASWDQIPSWSGSVTGGFNSTPGGSNAMELGANANGIGNDMVRVFNGLNQGQVTLSSFVYQPTPQPGINDGQTNFILLNKYDHEGPKNWSTQILIDDTFSGSGIVIDLGGNAGITGTRTPVLPVFDQWVEVRVEVDLFNNSYDAFYDNIQIMDDNIWAGPTGEMQIAAVDLWNNGSQPNPGQYYWDDVQVDVTGGCGSCCPFDVVTCESECSTGSVELSWSTFQVGGYSQGISIYRDGALIADIAGDATSFIDTGMSPGVHNYEISGNCLGVSAGWSVSCALMHCDNVESDFCADATEVSLGSSTDFDTTFAVYDSSVPTGCNNGPFNPAPDVWFSFSPPCDGVFEIDSCGSLYDSQIEILDGGITGDCSVATPVTGTSCTDNNACGPGDTIDFQGIAGYTYLIRVTGFSYDTGQGILNLNLAPVSDLNAIYNCGSDQVNLNWNPLGPTYDSYEIIENGVTIATGITGSTFTAASPPPGENLYSVIGTSLSCSAISNVSVTGVSVPLPNSLDATDLIFRAEGPNGLIDSAGALEASLQTHGLTSTVIDAPPEFAPPCIFDTSVSSTKRIWYMGGTYPDDRPLSPDAQDVLVAAQSAGIHLYIESGDQWFIGVSPGLASIDGIAGGATDGDDSFVSMNGADSGSGLDTSDFLGISYSQDQGGNDYTDRIEASTSDSLGPDSSVIWRDGSNSYNTGVFYNTDSGGKVICQTWELGGFSGDLDDLTSRYLEVLGGLNTGPTQPTFRRGDSNLDGSFNIADQVFLLGALFSGGAPCGCPDACDQNDDGSVNIADAVFGLSSLFSGGPAPGAPGPDFCGEDPTDDTLDACVNGSC